MTESISELSRSRFLSIGDQTVALEPPAPALLGWREGRIIDQKFEILSLLGEGGMGSVYKARHLALNKDVALKTLRSSAITEEALQRFQREAQAIGRLNHPNIVQVFDFGITVENFPYYTMEYLSGVSLADYLAEKGSLPLPESLEIFLQVSDGLMAAHEKGIIHRDLKPANIFLSRLEAGGRGSYVVKIVDFGIASLTSNIADAQKLTATGTVFGSPLYMSPEQALGVTVTTSTDIYSSGCAFFEVLTGKPPFVGANALATIHLHQTEAPPKLSEIVKTYRVPQRLESLLAAMLAKDPGKRPKSFAEVKQELQAIKAISLTNSESSVVDEVDELRPTEGAFAFRKRATLIAAVSIIALLLCGRFVFFSGPGKAASKSASRSTAAQAPAAPSAAVEWDGRPFRIGAPATQRIFQFPGSQSLGKLEWDSVSGRRGKKRSVAEARGSVGGPAEGVALHLNPSELVEQNPRLLGGFGADDLEFLNFREGSHWTNEHIKEASKITGVIEIRISDALDVNDACIKHLNHFTNLRNLLIPGCGIKGGALAQLKRLPELNKLDLQGLSDPTPVLARLSKGAKISDLNLGHCELSNADIETLGKLGSLQSLALEDVRGLTDRNVSCLFHLPKLDNLNLADCSVSLDALRSLAPTSKIKTLTISGANLSAAAIASSRKECEAHGILLRLIQSRTHSLRKNVQEGMYLFQSGTN